MCSTTSHSRVVLAATICASAIAAVAAPTVVDELRLGGPADAGGHTISNLPPAFAAQIGAATTGALAAASAQAAGDLQTVDNALNARIDAIELEGATSLNAVLAVGNTATQDIVRVHEGWSAPLATTTNVADAVTAALGDAAADAASRYVTATNGAFRNKPTVDVVEPEAYVDLSDLGSDGGDGWELLFRCNGFPDLAGVLETNIVVSMARLNVGDPGVWRGARTLTHGDYGPSDHLWLVTFSGGAW